jgi:aminoglycoside phosphotransferase (APT) family kinase protein
MTLQSDRGAQVGDESLPASTRTWVQSVLGADACIIDVQRLVGGWSSEMRRLQVRSDAGSRSLVLRSFTKPFFIRHAEGLLNREAAILKLLEPSSIPVATVLAVDAAGLQCASPSLLRTHLPGAIQLQDEGVAARTELLAELLVKIHRLPVAEAARPRAYQVWTSPDRVRLPQDSACPELWMEALDVFRRPAPTYEGCFLHRDFHPGNVLFDQDDRSQLRVSGVVDWVETSWGPADLDVAHCSTALALLHGAEVGLHFGELYGAAGGRLAADRRARLYWYLLDALHYSPDAEKLVVAWREAGRSDLSAELVRGRLESYVIALMSRFA